MVKQEIVPRSVIVSDHYYDVSQSPLHNFSYFRVGMDMIIHYNCTR